MKVTSEDTLDDVRTEESVRAIQYHLTQLRRAMADGIGAIDAQNNLLAYLISMHEGGEVRISKTKAKFKYWSLERADDDNDFIFRARYEKSEA